MVFMSHQACFSSHLDVFFILCRYGFYIPSPKRSCLTSNMLFILLNIVITCSNSWTASFFREGIHLYSDIFFTIPKTWSSPFPWYHLHLPSVTVLIYPQIWSTSSDMVFPIPLILSSYFFEWPSPSSIIDFNLPQMQFSNFLRYC
jgi:hypothetical protein